MNDNHLYRKVETYSGHWKYEKLQPYQCDWRGFPCDGIWLVQSQPGAVSSQCILKIGELKELYPYAQMAQNVNELANFLVERGRANKVSTPSDFAEEILKFLASLGKSEPKKTITPGIRS